MTTLYSNIAQNAKLLLNTANCNLMLLRNASKKAGSSTRNSTTKVKPKHRGWKIQDGEMVRPGQILVLQRTTRFHPGLNVGMGKNGTLFAMETGKVMVTCEKIDPNWDHTWIQRSYNGREGQAIFKKHFNVVAERQHDRFVVIDRI